MRDRILFRHHLGMEDLIPHPLRRASQGHAIEIGTADAPSEAVAGRAALGLEQALALLHERFVDGLFGGARPFVVLRLRGGARAAAARSRRAARALTAAGEGQDEDEDGEESHDEDPFLWALGA